jgi:hypothetical protein
VPGDEDGLPDGGTVTRIVGKSGGKANLFGLPVNGLAKGNSVDVTVNLKAKVNSILREVDGGFPGPAGPPDETAGNVGAYFNCRQIWTGYIVNHLAAIHLIGRLRISPAITADGRLRIAIVNLSSPFPASQSLATCLAPFALFASGNPDSPDVQCNTPAGPLDRSPFNVGTTGVTDLAPMLTEGAAVAVSGDLTVQKLRGEVIVGGDTAVAAPIETPQPPAAQKVAAVKAVPGRARLLGPSGCVMKTFSARVRGSKLSTVTFRLDGKLVKRFRGVGSKTVAVRVNPASLRIGAHRLAVGVRFESGSGTKAKTLRLTFQRCDGKTTRPRFTG